MERSVRGWQGGGAEEEKGQTRQERRAGEETALILEQGIINRMRPCARKENR